MSKGGSAEAKAVLSRLAKKKQYQRMPAKPQVLAQQSSQKRNVLFQQAIALPDEGANQQKIQQNPVPRCRNMVVLVGFGIYRIEVGICSQQQHKAISPSM